MIYPPDRYRTASIRILIMGFFVLCLSFASKGQELDYRAQSLYIYKFTKFIYWPDGKASGDFVIGVFGNSPILEELKLMASIKKAVNDRNILVREVTAEDDLSQCQIIYVPSAKSRQLQALADKVEGLPVLIVAEREGMASKGATISFLVDNYEILKFEINTNRLKEQKLSISEEFLKLGYKL